MAPKRKKPEEENKAPPSGQLKTKRWSVQLKRLKGSMGLGIDDQYYVTTVKAGGAAAVEGSIEIGDHIVEINGVETGTLSKPIPKILPTNPDVPVKVCACARVLYPCHVHCGEPTRLLWIRTYRHAYLGLRVAAEPCKGAAAEPCKGAVAYEVRVRRAWRSSRCGRSASAQRASL